ncbi:O-antigen ligase family protein [Pseudomonas sp. S5(2021)]|nr:O-antigen ligase family protein [Pseudomonas sp. S5(2021)]
MNVKANTRMMNDLASLPRWLWLGQFWFLAMLAWAPSSKLYQQGLVVLLWLPTLAAAWTWRKQWAQRWRCWRSGGALMMGLMLWAALTLLWSETSQPLRTVKHLLYIALFWLSFVLLYGDARRERSLYWLFWLAGWGLSLSALASLLVFYGEQGNPLDHRLRGNGGLEHPILGGYVIGAALVWLLALLPEQRRMRGLTLVAVLPLLIFVAMTQSRGAYLALVSALVVLVLLGRTRVLGYAVVAIVLAGALGWWAFEPLLMARGASYRPEILLSAARMVVEAPWGVGIGADYDVRVDTVTTVFQHSHNLPLHVGIELGWPGMLIWMALWCAALLRAWRARRQAVGRLVFVLLVYAGVAMQFDAASLWDTPRAEWFISWLPLALAFAISSPKVTPGRCDRLRDPSLIGEISR